jgi:endo-1,4-beta-xylanase
MLALTGRAALSGAMMRGAMMPGAIMSGGLLLEGCGPPRAAGAKDGRRLAPAQELVGANSLKAHATACGLLTGFAVQPVLLDRDAAYAALGREQASLIVAENAMKWEALRPSATTYRFEAADGLVAFAEQNRMKIRGHNLLWHRSIPKWFTEMATRENARGLLTAHIEQVVGRYAGRMHSWDVVNEAIQVGDGRADGFRVSPWLKLIGDDYIETAFRAARRADPQALLTYNDYGIESESAEDERKRAAVLMMLRRMRARQVPVDAVGIQSHLSAGPAGAGGAEARFEYGAGLMRFVGNLRELGLQVFVTEMDVNDRALPAAVEERDERVAEVYGQYLKLVLADRAVTAVMMWGVTDRDTWLNHEDARADHVAERPLLFDAEGKGKQAFFTTRNSFDGRRVRPDGDVRAGL